jgi:GDP-4-dehydro-6-deoxy-D-mannose reductase
VYECNIHCQLNLLEALRSEAPNCRTLVVSSSEIYGAVGPEEPSIREDAPLRPNNPYAVSKVAQDLMALQYWTSHRLPTIRARSFPHIGPGQSEFFVISAFAKQIAEIEQGLHEPVIHVGNLDVQRDFTDVRDVVRAYWLLATQGAPGECYNVGSGRSHSIRGILESLLKLSIIKINVQVDPSRIRPNDLPVSCCNNVKLRETIGWQLEIDLQRTLVDVLDYWRRAEKGQAA